MDQNPLPGAFILEAAESGLQAASALSGFAPSSKTKNLASQISLSATLLSEVGKEVNKNADCFTENFQQTFQHVMVTFKKDYEKVLIALEKAASWKKGDAGEGSEDPPRKPWGRLLFALGMDEDAVEEFGESLDESLLRALMLQYIVQLVVLQIRARKQDLTASELNTLGKLKKKLGILLESIRESEVASVVAFGLSDLTTAANAVQVREAAELAAEESCSADDTSSISTTATIINPSPGIITPVKMETVVEVSEERPAPVFVAHPRSLHEDKYEMYRASTNIHSKSGNKTVHRFLGIPLHKVERTEIEIIWNFVKVPTTIEEIKAFIEKEKDDKITQPATLKSLVNVSPISSTVIYSLLRDKNEERIFPRRKWTTELLVPYEWWESKRLGIKLKKTDGYIVIVRGEVTSEPFPPRRGRLGPPPGGLPLPGPPPASLRGIGGPPPPPPSNWPSMRGGPPVIVNMERARPSKKSKVKKGEEQKSVAQIELTQQETETVVNDFLATFSTLYDGISMEARGAALKAIDLEAADDLLDYDSDDSSSTSSSLVDD